MPKNQRPQSPSYSQDLTDIVERYSSPIASFSPTLNHQSYDSTPRPGDGDDSFMSFPSSPLPYKSMMTPPLPAVRRRRTSTNSGYLSRAELFGRLSPTLSNEIRTNSASSALKRVEARQQADRPAPEDGSNSSPLAEIPQANERVIRERQSMRSLRASNGRSSTPYMYATTLSRRVSTMSLQGTSANGCSGILSTTDLRSSQLGRRSSAMSMLSQFADNPPDEWMEAGTPVQELKGDGYGPGPTVSNNRALSFHSGKGHSSDSRASLFSRGISPNHSDRKISTVSPAHEALRQTLECSASLAAPQVRKSSWTRRIFGRTEHSPASCPTPTSPASDENISEFEYIEPRMPTESPEIILGRSRTRRTALHRHIGGGVGAVESSRAPNALDGSYSGERSPLGSIYESHPHASIGEINSLGCTPSSRAASLGPVEEPYVDEDKDSAKHQALLLELGSGDVRIVLEGVVSSRPTSLQSLEEVCAVEDGVDLEQRLSVPVSPQADGIMSGSTSEIPCAGRDDMFESQLSVLSSPQREVTSIASTPMSITQSTTKLDQERAVQSVVMDLGMALSPVVVVHDEPSTPPVNTLTFSSPTNVFNQPTQDSVQELILAPTMEVMSHAPVISSSTHSLSFATANAVLYACTTFATLQHILMRIGEEVCSFDLAHDMGIAFVIGMVVCAVMHCVLNGRVEQVRRQ
jgi:hypothetical protein